jgi:hypothetical protein
MSNPSWQTIKEFVHNRAGGCCEYCQTCEINIGQAMHVEHINPTRGDDLDNLCLACPNCNLSKAAAITAVDPETDREVPLFNPRNQKWIDHFEWNENHTQIRGVSPIGRATAIRFKMNRPRIVLTRQRWAQAGLHPVGQVGQ